MAYGHLDNLSIEEKEKVYLYWIGVDDTEDLTGIEMPSWWREKYLVLPDYVSEENVSDIFYDEETRKKLYDYYYSTYFVCDCISGRGNTYDMTRMSPEEIRTKYLTNESGQLFDTWLDYVYGGMYEYVNNMDSPRAVRYGLSTKMYFPNLTIKDGVYNVYNSQEDAYLEFCINTYLSKYNRVDAYNKKPKLFQSNIDKLIAYIKEDSKLSEADRKLNVEELQLLKDEYVSNLIKMKEALQCVPEEEKGVVRDYLTRSLRQVIKGNYTDEVTVLGTAGQILMGFFDIDIIGDVRDLSADIIYTAEGKEVPVVQGILDTIALLPAIGVLKYTDEVGTLGKNALKSAEKYTGELSTLGKNALNSVDEFIEGIKDLFRNGFDNGPELAVAGGPKISAAKSDDAGRVLKNEINNEEILDATSDINKKSESLENAIKGSTNSIPGRTNYDNIIIDTLSETDLKKLLMISERMEVRR